MSRYRPGGVRNVPMATLLAIFWGNFERIFSASFFVLKGFDKTFGSRSTYSNNTQRTEIFM
jgi:hypothetical protein